ncbi:hypothetical protein K457DRAFT_125681 [Linnemannia elongata AG-77]|uniref:GYF domain-containing protein n=1 Tax=Linnemannia elongata AG-77 TaxID=1314771 RepID=A0A197JZC7_9FUNG|nr:hypothetical protein K457DRAFT_125681 [Linnemannia elongata AG-77]
MASNTMNFGPEWMRRFPARTSQSQPDLLTRASSPPPPVTPTHQDWGQPAPSASQAALPAFSYSSIAASNVRSHNGAPGSDTSVLDTTSGGSSNGNASSFASDSLNPFKYSKELMIALYKPTGLPIEFERHAVMTSEDPLAPMSTLPFSEHEIKLLSGNVNSEVARRTTQPGDSPLERPQGQRRESFSNTGDNSGRYDRSEKPSSYTRGYDSRGHATGTRPRTLNSENRSHSFRRTEQVMVERESEPEDDGLWNSPVGNTVGSFDANGVFRISGEGEELQPLAELEESPAVLSNDEVTETSPVEEDDDLSGVKTSILSLQTQEPTYSGHGSEKPDAVSPTLSQHAAEPVASVENNRISVTMLTGKPTEAFAARDSDEFTSFGGKPPLSASHPPGLVAEPGFKSLPVEMSKWLYRDPSGSIQGPFLSGEMHEWYKGGFFTSDLLVKREQDSTFEPLGSLIRRVGSDDQPFLTAGVIRPEPPQPPVHPNRPSIPSLAQNRQPVPQLPQSPGWMGMSAPSTPSTANFGADRLMLQQQQVQQQHSSGDLFSSTNGLGQQRSGFGGAQEPVALSALESRWSSAQFSRPHIAESNAGWGGDAFSRSPVASMAAAHTPLGSAHYMEQQQRLHNQELERQQYMQLLQRQAQMQSIMHQQQFMAARQQFGTDPQALAALLAQQQAQQRQLQMRYQQLQFTGFHAQGPSTPGGTAVPWGGMGQPSSPWTTSIIPSSSDNYFDHNKGEGSQAPYSMRQQPTPMQPPQPHQQLHQPFQPFQQEHTQLHLGRPSEPVMQFDQAPQPLAQESQQQRQQQELHQHQSQTAQDQTFDAVTGKMADLQVQEDVGQEAAKDDLERMEQTLPVVEEVTRAEDVKANLEHLGAAVQEQVQEEEKFEDWEEIEDPVNELAAQHERKQQDIKEESVHDDESVGESLVHEEHELAETVEDTASETALTTATEDLPAPSSTKPNPAPWAKPTNVDDEVVEKGLSLREIQELEAKKSEATKAERQAQLAAASALAGGNGAFDFTKGMSGAPAWSSSAPTTPKKKTLKEIQEEEEEATIKKNRAAAKQAQTAGLTAIVTSNTGSVGKRYADTIGPKPVSSIASSGPWNMSPVTASRPTSVTRSSLVFAANPSAPSPTTPHSRGSENSWIEVGSKRDSHPTPATVTPAVTRNATTPAHKTVSSNEPRPASEEFLRWCRQALRGLQGVVLEDFIQMLLTFPLNPDPMTVEIIQDSIYANSQSLNGRQFAEEFIKRRKADAFPNGAPASMVSGHTPSSTPDSSFKVVSKKGKKKGTL